MDPRPRLLGVRSGIGLYVGNMVGAGVFVSAGFMAQDMGPATILAAWAVGALIARGAQGQPDRDYLGISNTVRA